MWHHTTTHHQSVIGPNNGIMDYKFVLTGTFHNNLDRLVDEWHRQTVFKEYHMKNVLEVLNSKIDFVQPLRTQLTTITKSANVAPGRLDKVIPNKQLKQPTTTNKTKDISVTTNKE